MQEGLALSTGENLPPFYYTVGGISNRRIFYSVQRSGMQVALLAKEEIDLYKLAFRYPQL
jgi:hypothetical protein